jgi:hypothetical protein
MACISGTLRRIANDLEQYLPESSVLDAFRAAGHAWRERQLEPTKGEPTKGDANL